MGLFRKMLEFPGKPLMMSGKLGASPLFATKAPLIMSGPEQPTPVSLLFGNSLVQIKDDAGHGSPGRQFPNVQLAVDFGLTHVQQPLCGFWIMMIARYFALRQVPHNLPLVCTRLA